MSLLGAICLALAACDRGGSSSPVATARDSAGIRVVESTPDASTDSCAIPTEPEIEIGAREGPDEYQLYRVMDATRLSDGRIAVVNQGSSEIRLYDEEGRFLHAFGREGDGPGEFRKVFLIWTLAGDTLLVGDYGPWRFFEVTPEGELVRQFVPQPRYLNTPDVIGVLDDGTFVLGRECCRTQEPGFHEMHLDLVRHDASGAATDTLGVYPRGSEGYLDREKSPTLVGSPLFEARTRVAAAGDRIVVGPGTERELRLLGPAGELRGLVRWTGPGRDVTSEEVAIYREELLSDYEGRPEWRRRFAEPMVSEDRPVADRFPAHGTLLLDEGGDIWVRRYAQPSWPDEDDDRWLVFRGDGRFLCHARTPPAIENVWDLREIGDDYLLATVRDTLGVEYVRRYSLRKPTRPDG